MEFWKKESLSLFPATSFVILIMIDDWRKLAVYTSWSVLLSADLKTVSSSQRFQ
jgi:hypothetical protein